MKKGDIIDNEKFNGWHSLSNDFLPWTSLLSHIVDSIHNTPMQRSIESPCYCICWYNSCLVYVFCGFSSHGIVQKSVWTGTLTVWSPTPQHSAHGLQWMCRTWPGHMCQPWQCLRKIKPCMVWTPHHPWNLNITAIQTLSCLCFMNHTLFVLQLHSSIPPPPSVLFFQCNYNPTIVAKHFLGVSISFTSYMSSMAVGVAIGWGRVVHKVHTPISTSLKVRVSVINPSAMKLCVIH